MTHKNNATKSETENMIATLGFGEEEMNNLLSDESDFSDEDFEEKIDVSLPSKPQEPVIVVTKPKEETVPIEKYKKLQSEFEQLQRDNDTLKKQMKENKQVEAQKKQNKLLMNQIQKLKDEKEALSNTIEDFRANSTLLSQSKAKKDDESLLKELEELRNEVSTLRDKSESLQISLSKEKDEVKNLTQQKSFLDQHIAQLNKEITNINNNSKAIESSKAANQTYKTEIASLEQKLKASEEKYIQQAALLKSTSEAQTKEITKLNQKLEEAERANQSSSLLSKEITGLKEQFKAAELKYNDQIKVSETKYTEQINLLKLSNESLSKEITQLKQKLETTENINQSLTVGSKESTDKLSKELNNLQQKLSESESKYTSLQKEMDQKIKTIENEKLSLNETISQLNQKATTLEREKELNKKSDSEQIHRLNQEIETWKSKEEKERNLAAKYAQAVKKLDSDLKKSKSDIEESELKIAQLIKQRDSSAALMTKLKSLKKSVNLLKQMQLNIKKDSKSQIQECLNSISELGNGIKPIFKVADSATEKYKEESKKRRILYNELQDLKGKIRICVRVRPILNSDKSEGPSVKCTPDIGEVKVSDPETKKTYKYEFDKVFNPKTSQEQVFDEVKGLATSILDGYNVCIFAYGQTGSGKTHTMDGIQSDRGLNYRTIAELFNISQERKDEFNYSFKISCTEIYMEQVFDLLAKSKTPLKLQMAGSTTKIVDLTKVDVDDVNSVFTQFDRSKQNRAQACTDMNEHSSRSHAVVSIYVKGINKITGVKYSGKLNLIDLAGSERVKLSGVTGQRMEEAKSINSSLSALGDVISALGAKKGHIPYRNSKLTSMLQDSLGGNSKVMMFVNVSPCIEHSSETVFSLKFANRVKEVELGKVKANVKKTKEDKPDKSD